MEVDVLQSSGAGDWDGFWSIHYPAYVEGRPDTYDGIGREVISSDLYFSFSHEGDWDAHH